MVAGYHIGTVQQCGVEVGLLHRLTRSPPILGRFRAISSDRKVWLLIADNPYHGLLSTVSCSFECVKVSGTKTIFSKVVNRCAGQTGQ